MRDELFALILATDYAHKVLGLDFEQAAEWSDQHQKEFLAQAKSPEGQAQKRQMIFDMETCTDPKWLEIQEEIRRQMGAPRQVTLEVASRWLASWAVPEDMGLDEGDAWIDAHWHQFLPEAEPIRVWQSALWQHRWPTPAEEAGVAVVMHRLFPGRPERFWHFELPEVLLGLTDAEFERRLFGDDADPE